MREDCQKTSFTLKYRLTRGVLILLGLPFTRRICGIENFPKEGAYILAANHASHVDWMFIVNRLTAILDRHIHCFATTKYFKNPLFRYYVNEEKGIWVDLKEPGRALLIGLDYLKKGEVLGTFPEGTRSKDGRLHDFKAGAMVLAVKSGVPIVPVAIIGTYEILPKGKLLMTPGQVQIRVGRPIETKDRSTRDKHNLARTAQEAVAELLRP